MDVYRKTTQQKYIGDKRYNTDAVEISKLFSQGIATRECLAEIWLNFANGPVFFSIL
jgi:hypothetical protein